MKSIQLANERRHGIFHQKVFWFPHDVNPNYNDLKTLIESGGGKVLARKNNSLKKEIIVLVDKSKDKKYHDGFTVCLTELIFISVLR